MPGGCFRNKLSHFQNQIKKLDSPRFKSRHHRLLADWPLSKILHRNLFHYLQNCNHNVYFLGYCEDYEIYMHWKYLADFWTHEMPLKHNSSYYFNNNNIKKGGEKDQHCTDSTEVSDNMLDVLYTISFNPLNNQSR